MALTSWGPLAPGPSRRQIRAGHRCGVLFKPPFALSKPGQNPPSSSRSEAYSGDAARTNRASRARSQKPRSSPSSPPPNRPHKRKPKFEPVVAHIYANLPAWCHGQGEEAIGALNHRGVWREPEYRATQYRNGIHAFIREAHYDDNWSPTSS